jgi:hypothetical protein
MEMLLVCLCMEEETQCNARKELRTIHKEYTLVYPQNRKEYSVMNGIVLVNDLKSCTVGYSPNMIAMPI